MCLGANAWGRVRQDGRKTLRGLAAALGIGGLTQQTLGFPND